MTRSTQTLEEQVQLLRLFLKSGWTEEDEARAMRTTSVLGLGGQRRNPGNAAFTHVVHSVLGRAHPHLQAYGMNAVGYLPPEDQVIVLGCLRLGCTRREIGHALHIAEDTVAKRLGESLRRLACMLWDADYHPIPVPPRPKVAVA